MRPRKEIKNQKVESELYEKLYKEYLFLHGKFQDGNLSPFLQTMNKARLIQIEKQMNALT